MLIFIFLLYAYSRVSGYNRILSIDDRVDESITNINNYNSNEYIYLYVINKIYYNINDPYLLLVNKECKTGGEDIDTRILSQLILANNMYYGNGIVSSDGKLCDIYRSISSGVYERFKENRWDFKAKIYYGDDKKINIMDMIHSGESINKILEVIESRIVEIDENIIKYLLRIKNSRAYGILGEIYYFGVSVKKNLTLAMHYFRLGAEGNDGSAYNGMGLIYESKNDVTNSKLYYEEAVKHGSVDALYNIYNLYQKILPYENIGIAYLTMAAQKKYLPAIHMMGEIYFNNKEYRKAIHNYCLVSLYDINIKKIADRAYLEFKDKKYRNALNLLTVAAECGDLVSMKNIVYLLKYHVKNNKLLMHYLMVLVRSGDNTFINMLGDCYYYNVLEKDHNDFSTVMGAHGNAENKKIAFGYYLSGALHKNCESYYNMHLLLSRGIGCMRDYRGSIAYLLRLYESEKNAYILVTILFGRMVFIVIYNFILDILGVRVLDSNYIIKIIITFLSVVIGYFIIKRRFK